MCVVLFLQLGDVDKVEPPHWFITLLLVCLLRKQLEKYPLSSSPLLITRISCERKRKIPSAALSATWNRWTCTQRCRDNCAALNQTPFFLPFQKKFFSFVISFFFFLLQMIDPRAMWRFDRQRAQSTAKIQREEDEWWHPHRTERKLFVNNQSYACLWLHLLSLRVKSFFYHFQDTCQSTSSSSWLLHLFIHNRQCNAQCAQ